MNFTSLRLRKIKVSFHLFSSNNNIWMCFHNENIWNKWVYDTTSISVWKQDESTMAMTNEKIRVNERTSAAKVKKRMFYQVVVSAHTLTHKQNHYSWLAGWHWQHTSICRNTATRETTRICFLSNSVYSFIFAFKKVFNSICRTLSMPSLTS